MNSLEFLNEAKNHDRSNNPVFGGCRIDQPTTEGFDLAVKAASEFFHVTDSAYNSTKEINLCNMYVDNMTDFNNR